MQDPLTQRVEWYKIKFRPMSQLSNEVGRENFHSFYYKNKIAWVLNESHNEYHLL